MPFYEGQTLKDTLKTLSAPPDEAWLRGLLLPLSEALKVIHAESCYHRDIAPDNIILLGAHTRPLLLDFGAARRVISDMTQALTVILKPGYAPLEQYAEVPHMKQGPWTDIYALAAVVYFAITRRTPPPSVGRMMGDTYVPLRQVAAGKYSDSFLHAIDRALSVKPEDRPQSVAQLIAELDQPLPATVPMRPEDFGLDDDKTIIRPIRASAPKTPPPAFQPASPPMNPPAAPRAVAPSVAPAPAVVEAPARASSSRTPLFVGAGALGLVKIGRHLEGGLGASSGSISAAGPLCVAGLVQIRHTVRHVVASGKGQEGRALIFPRFVSSSPMAAARCLTIGAAIAASPTC